MKTAPKVFCPSCGVPWHKAAEPKPDRKTKIPARPKTVTNVVQDKPVKKKATTRKKTAAKKKPAAKKKGSR